MSSEGSSVDVGRLARLLGLIAIVTMVGFLGMANALPSSAQSIGFVTVGSVALVTAITSYFIAMGAAFDEAERRAASARATEHGEDTLDQ